MTKPAENHIYTLYKNWIKDISTGGAQSLPPADDYVTAYNLNENNTGLHPQIAETQEAEEIFNTAIQGIDAETQSEIDSAVGRIARAYEMQGFLYGANCCRTQDETGGAVKEYMETTGAFVDALKRAGCFTEDLEETYHTYIAAAMKAAYYAGFETARDIYR